MNNIILMDPSQQDNASSDRINKKVQGKIIDLVTNSVDSKNSKRAYQKALTDFFTWYEDPEYGQCRQLRKNLFDEYREHLMDCTLAPASVNLRLSAVRKMIQEAVSNLYLDEATAQSILQAKGVKTQGNRTGNWLGMKDAQRLINTPNTSVLKGKRDRAILSVLIGCGLRRFEVAALTFRHMQMRDGRWVFVDIVGKGNRIRSVSMPAWTKQDIDQWTKAAEISSGYLFRAIHWKTGKVIKNQQSITAQTIRDIVAYSAKESGLQIAAHDLRRTYAKLACKGGAELKRIQISRGHASIRTTEIYLGVEQSLGDAPCDYINFQ